MPLPLALLPFFTPPYTYLDADGLEVLNVGGKIYTRDTDLTTPVAVYQDQDGDAEHTNPIIIDTAGWIPSSAIYVPPQGISIIYADADDNVIRTIAFVEDVGSAFLSTQANIQADGTTATTSPYTVGAEDNTVTVDSADDPFVVQLPDATDRGTPLIIKSNSAVEVRITPDGAQTIDLIAAYVVLPAAGSPPLPGMTLLSDGTSNWVIASTVGL